MVIATLLPLDVTTCTICVLLVILLLRPPNMPHAFFPQHDSNQIVTRQPTSSNTLHAIIEKKETPLKPILLHITCAIYLLLMLLQNILTFASRAITLPVYFFYKRHPFSYHVFTHLTSTPPRENFEHVPLKLKKSAPLRAAFADHHVSAYHVLHRFPCRA